jgi:hypothetical protein
MQATAATWPTLFIIRVLKYFAGSSQVARKHPTPGKRQSAGAREDLLLSNIQTTFMQ